MLVIAADLRKAMDNTLLDLPKLKRHIYAVFFCLKTGLNLYIQLSSNSFTLYRPPKAPTRSQALQPQSVKFLGWFNCGALTGFPCNIHHSLSIAFFGVGDGQWDAMKQFGDNIPAFDNLQLQIPLRFPFVAAAISSS
ncbi:unnamed protein product [Linum tenue]|uniref:Uncharacterized protein n=1 Tax=Linum tenue TaxID=586396 RepID=A0AAV0S8J6_9ROSI|nr:unnamed protein product [Linum tenue]